MTESNQRRINWVHVARAVFLPFAAGFIGWKATRNTWLAILVTSVTGGVIEATQGRAPKTPPRRETNPAAPLDADALVKERTSRLRHDIKGALSPALLLADQLSMHSDDAIRTKADTIATSIETASKILSGRA